MEYTVLFWVIISIIIIGYIFDSYISRLNAKASSQKPPAEVADLYDKDQYEKQQAYFAANTRFGTISSGIILVVTLLLFFLFGFKYLDVFVRSFDLGDTLTSVLFMVILGVLSDIVSIPFSYYSTFVIEEKFGFNKSTVKTFVTDTIKSILISAVLSGVVVAALSLAYYKIGENYWIVGLAVIASLTLFFSMFGSTLIVPLFNKQTPLEDGSLKDKIKEYCDKVGFQVSDLFVIDGSKRSTKANAYFSGLGSKKRICLYDTLIEKMTEDEIVAVLAHEIGHYKKRHIWWMLIVNTINIGFVLFLSSLVLGAPETGNPTLAAALGCEPSFHIGLMVFFLLYSPLSDLTEILQNAFSRRNEYQADAFAANSGMGEHLISGLRKLTSDSLSNLTPHPAFVFCKFSHPTLVQRIRAIRTITGVNKN